MKVAELIKDIEGLEIVGDASVEVKSLTLDSREAAASVLFAAIPGSRVDGHDYIPSAIKAGSNVILCEKIEKVDDSVCYIKAESASKALGLLAANFYGKPSEKLQVVGVTGTNGKTSITTLLYQTFNLLGHRSGLLSTIKYCIGEKEYVSTHTTPHAIRIQELLAEMVDAGCEYAFMEVSSHAIDQNRISGLHFRGAVFTNITHDHLDYHKDFRSYLYCKKQLFDGLSADAFALYNRDDKNGAVMVQNTKASKYSYSLKSMSDFKTRIIEHDFQGMLLDIRGDELWLRLVGKFNAYNALAVYGVAFLLGKEHFEIITALSKLESVEGRFQHVKHNNITAIIDYAHTPDALLNVLETITAIRTNNEQLITVVGCGGNRDKEKRPTMAKLAVQFSSKVIITSDNPRDEDPEQIIKEMMTGVDPANFKKVLKITDREEAIKTAISLSSPGDIILVAGKGHEKYQEIKGVRHPFDDKEIVKSNLKLIHN